MKTYLLDILNRYKKFSESLDVEAILCSKSWSVFNDSGCKEIYLFQHDGSLIISVSGEVTNATWKGEFYQFNLSSCIRQQNSLTAQFVSFSLSNLANIFYPPQFLQ